MKRSSEQKIIEQIKDGDAAKFRLLVDEYKTVSFSLACSIIKNEQDAEDVLQEAFIKAFQGLKTFNFQSSFSTWLYRIVVNQCRTRYAKQKSRNEILHHEENFSADLETENDPLKLLLEEERKQLVGKVMCQMSSEEALMLQLYYLAELSVAEMQEITRFSESKIKVSLFRARKSFKKKLVETYGKDYERTRY
ncbi:MAG: RNA polymerase sigma factor [Mangrovibacterium sp.]